MSYLIDRRLNGKNKSTVNRQRFMRRYRQHIKKAVADAVSNRSITDIEKGEKITIPSKDVHEPVLGHGSGGKRTIVSPGNHDFTTGDKIPRPSGGAGGGGGKKASNSGEGVDDFVFQISQSEFLEFMFDDLALPNLVKRQLAGTESFKYRHGGFTTTGTPSQINVVRSLRAANARRIALGAKRRKQLAELEVQLAQCEHSDPVNRQQAQTLSEKIDALKKQLKKIPYLDEFDIRYNLKVKEPIPSSKALMFCIMDVSGSMDQATKEKAKRFFILLYLFLKRNYQHIEVVFIRHHTSAKEVDEDEFFYSRETGGTIVSSALKLTHEIIAKRYPVSEWNIYAAQASDGDNWNDDSSNCRDILEQQLLPLLQHFSYIEITPREHQSLWYEYEQLAEQFPYQFAMQQIVENHDIYPVFRELFRRRENEQSH